MSEIVLSASSISRFYTCPMAYKLSRQYKLAQEPQHFKDGTDAHAMMTGANVPTASPKALEYFKSLDKLRTQWGLKIEKGHQEVDQKFEIYPGIILHRIVDALAMLHDNLLVIDWKTASMLDYWAVAVSNANLDGGSTYGKVYPKAAGFQAIAYLIPPPKDEMKRLKITSWPNTIYFAVGTSRGTNAMYPYTLQEGDIENFIGAARMCAAAIRQDIYPKVKDSCKVGEPMECSYLSACYQVKDWEKSYVKKEIRE